MSEHSEAWAGILELPCRSCGGTGTLCVFRYFKHHPVECLECHGAKYRQPADCEINDYCAKLEGYECDNCGEIGACDCREVGIGCGVPDYLTNANHALMMVKGKSVMAACVNGQVWGVSVCDDHDEFVEAKSFCEALCLAAAKAQKEASK